MNPLPSSATAAAAKDKRTKQPPGGTDLGKDSSRDARRVAAMILEVLAGSRTTSDAAGALGISLTRYYLLETRAMQGLVVACEPRTQGRQRSLTADLEALRRECERLRREALRQQTLLRAAQRSVGLTAPPAAPAKGSSKKRQRRPVARALSAAAHLQATDNGMSVGEPSATDRPQQQPMSNE
jgi:hypothetical protein